jgi:DNA uptake protein ComE-like DNA-binding protein
LDKFYFVNSTKIPIEKELLIQENEENVLTHHFKANQKDKIILKDFNPNSYQVEGWQNLGFSKKQAEIIIKYRNKLGGNFSTIEEISECFVISEEKMNEIRSYIKLKPVKNNSKDFKTIVYQDKKFDKTLSIKGKFNPNTYQEEDWQSLGFSEKQAQTIVKYKKILGGEFTSIEQIEKCFVISEENYKQLKPYLLISSKPKMQMEKISDVKVKDLNSATFDDFSTFELTDQIKGRILSFRKILGGFAKKEQLLEVYGIESSVAEKIMQNFSLNSSKIIKINLNTSDESILKKHPYFKKYHQELIKLRQGKTIQLNDLKSIINSTKDLEKMSWYVED